MKGPNRNLSWCLSVLLLDSTAVLAQDFGRIEEVLRYAFASESAGTRAPLSLRIVYLPSFHPEAEIAVNFPAGNGKATVDLIVADRRVTKVIEAWPSYTAAELAKKFKVKRTRIQVPSEVSDRWLHEFWTRLSASTKIIEANQRASQVQLDGSLLVLQYSDGITRLRLELPGPDQPSGSREGSPIVSFTGMIWEEVAGFAR